MEKELNVKVIFVVLAMLMVLGSAPGDVFAAQPGNRGDGEDDSKQTYRAFVTRQQFTGNLGGTTGADQKCQEVADTSGLGGRWQAWIGTLGLNQMGKPDIPIYNWRTKSATPYVNLRGGMVAENFADLLSVHQLVVNQTLIMHPLHATIQYDENGNDFEIETWTGLAENGGPLNSNCEGWTSDSSGDFGSAGFTENLGPKWTNDTNRECSGIAHLYCFEQ